MAGSNSNRQPDTRIGRDVALLQKRSTTLLKRVGASLIQAFLFLVASSSTLAVLFIFYFIAKDAIPFFRLEGFREFFASTQWHPAADDPSFGSLSIFFGTGLVTAGAIFFSVPLGVAAAVCLSDVLPFSVRQAVKPVVEVLAAIPSVAYGFFALVVFAPLLQNHGGPVLAVAVLVILAPLAALAVFVISDVAADKLRGASRRLARLIMIAGLGGLCAWGLAGSWGFLFHLHISSGTNALNASIILGIMALPTIVSVSEDALTAAGRELREGSYAMGATRAETILKVIVPAARSGIFAAVILGIMRAVGETMVVWMASGNATQIPEPWYDLLEPVKTLTATIAGEMGEADQTTGSSRYHVLFAMALCLLVFSLLCNLASEWIVRRGRKKLGK